MSERIRRIAMLGSTGSVGRQTLDIVRQHSNYCRVVGLAARSNLDLIAQQVAEFRPTRGAFPREVPGAVAVSMEELASAPDVDLVVVATVGKARLSVTLAAIAAGKVIPMANKEIIVMAGSPVMTAARKHGVTVLPFLEQQIGFQEIPRIVRTVLMRYQPCRTPLWRTCSTPISGPGTSLRSRFRDRVASPLLARPLPRPFWLEEGASSFPAGLSGPLGDLLASPQKAGQDENKRVAV